MTQSIQSDKRFLKLAEQARPLGQTEEDAAKTTASTMLLESYKKKTRNPFINTFLKNHPAWEEPCDTVLSLLSGSFALLAIIFVWVKELIGRKKTE